MAPLWIGAQVLWAPNPALPSTHHVAGGNRRKAEGHRHPSHKFSRNQCLQGAGGSSLSLSLPATWKPSGLKETELSQVHTHTPLGDSAPHSAGRPLGLSLPILKSTSVRSPIGGTWRWMLRHFHSSVTRGRQTPSHAWDGCCRSRREVCKSKWESPTGSLEVASLPVGGHGGK